MKNHQDLIKYACPEMHGLPFSMKMPSFLFERNIAWEEERGWAHTVLVGGSSPCRREESRARLCVRR